MTFRRVLLARRRFDALLLALAFATIAPADLVAKERLGVLWATHLMDEVLRTDQVIILHKGVVLFNGGVPQLLSQTGTTSVREAFRAVTGTKAPIEEAA